MVDLTATELSQRLQLSRRQVTELLSSGVIDGRQLSSGAWLADSDSVARYEAGHRRGSGRTLDASTAWAMLWMLSGLDADWVTPSTRSRVRARLRHSSAERLARDVAARTRAHRFEAANSARAREGLIATGRAVAGLLGVGLMDDRRFATGYARATAVEHAATRFMVESPTGPHVIYDNTLPIEYDGDVMPLAVVAADLAVSTDVREHAGGLRALENLMTAWRATAG